MTQSRFVFGIEGDYTWMSLDGQGVTGALAGTERFHTDYDQSASVRGRLGYSPMSMPNVLFYGTGGWAGANLSQANYVPLAPALNPFRSGWTNGWVAGVGFESRLLRTGLPAWNICTQNMTVRISCTMGRRR